MLLMEERPVQVGTVAELREEIHAYERRYGMDTEAFLALVAAQSPELDVIEDADFWYQAHRILQRMLAEGGSPPEWVQNPELLAEGSKEPLVIYGHRALPQ